MLASVAQDGIRPQRASENCRFAVDGRRKAELVQYMAWKTAERTLKAYEHVVRDSDFIDTTLNSIHKAMKQREQQVKKDPGLLAQFATVQSHDVSKALDEDIAILTGALA